MSGRHQTKLLEEVKDVENKIGGPMSHEARLAFDLAYSTAANYWHNAGLTEGWNDHIKKLAQLMEPLGGKGDE